MNYSILKNRLHSLVQDNKKLIIYPMGEKGCIVKGILNGQLGIKESYIIDNALCNKCSWIYPVSILGKICCEDYLVLIACEHIHYSREIVESLKPYNIEYYDLFHISEQTYEETIAENYSKHVCYDKTRIENQLRERLKQGTPFACGRLGHTECMIAYEYCMMRLGIQDSFSEKFSQFLLTTSGFFSSRGKEKTDIEQYAEMTINAIKDMDIHLVWEKEGEAFLLRNYADNMSDFVQKGIVHTPWNAWGGTWMNGLYGKRVLVVSPFSESIKMQYKRRRELFENENNLPDFELITYQSLETQMGDNKGFSNWFEAYQYMEKEILQIEFDVAIIGCGAYGYPLTAAIKRAGRQAIEMCSSTQLMFGIKAKRWVENRNESVTKWWNDAWIYPMETPPKHYEQIEDGCYWG